MSQTQALGASMRVLNSLEPGRTKITLPPVHGLQQKTSLWPDMLQPPMNGSMLMVQSVYTPPIPTILAVSGKMETDLTGELGYTMKTHKKLDSGGMKPRLRAENSTQTQIQPGGPSKLQLTEQPKSLEPGSTPMVHKAPGRKIQMKRLELGLMKMADLVVLTLMIAQALVEPGGQTRRVAHGKLAVLTLWSKSQQHLP